MRPVLANETVHYGVQPTMSPVYIAIALGLLAPIEQKDGVRFLFQRFQNGSAENQAIADRPLEMLSEDVASCVVAASRFSATLVAIDMQGPGGGSALCVSDVFLGRRPEVTQDVVNALARASEFITKHPKAVAKLWAKQIDLPEGAIAATLTRHVSRYGRDIVPTKARVDAYLATLRHTKVLSVRDLPKVDPSFARRALAQPSL